jgi:hypothetical protein
MWIHFSLYRSRHIVNAVTNVCNFEICRTVKIIFHTTFFYFNNFVVVVKYCWILCQYRHIYFIGVICLEFRIQTVWLELKRERRKDKNVLLGLTYWNKFTRIHQNVTSVCGRGLPPSHSLVFPKFSSPTVVSLQKKQNFTTKHEHIPVQLCAFSCTLITEL